MKHEQKQQRGDITTQDSIQIYHSTEEINSMAQCTTPVFAQWVLRHSALHNVRYKSV